MASVVFKPLPVIETTVVSCGWMRPWAISFCVTPVVTPPAVSVKMPSVSARSLMATTISGSEDRKSTRLNSSHTVISYAVFCLKKKKKGEIRKSRCTFQARVHGVVGEDDEDAVS